MADQTHKLTNKIFKDQILYRDRWTTLSKICINSPFTWVMTVKKPEKQRLCSPCNAVWGDCSTVSYLWTLACSFCRSEVCLAERGYSGASILHFHHLMYHLHIPEKWDQEISQEASYLLEKVTLSWDCTCNMIKLKRDEKTQDIWRKLSMIFLPSTQVSSYHALQNPRKFFLVQLV